MTVALILAIWIGVKQDATYVIVIVFICIESALVISKSWER